MPGTWEVVRLRVTGEYLADHWLALCLANVNSKSRMKLVKFNAAIFVHNNDNSKRLDLIPWRGLLIIRSPHHHFMRTMKERFGQLRARLFLAGIAVALSIVAVVVVAIVGAVQREENRSGESNLVSASLRSIAPSLSPSLLPSQEPTVMSSEVPTGNPSTMPSLEPTISPAPTISMLPSLSPTEMPTISSAPTFKSFDKWTPFRLKMHFEPDYYWQNSREEKFW